MTAPRRSAPPARNRPWADCTLPEPPSANRYWRHVGSRVVLSADAKAYRAAVRTWWILAGCPAPISGPVALTFRWFRARRAGDLDNRTKQLLDALTGYAFEDDAQIEELHCYRDDSEPKAARVVVTLSPLAVCAGDPDPSEATRHE